MPERALTAHKYDCGSIFVFSGSVGMTGAPALAAMGALHSGAGLVTAAVPSCIADIIAQKLTEPLILSLPGDWHSFAADAGEFALNHIKKTNAAVIGPGIQNTSDAAEAMRYLIRNADCPLVIDAGALPFANERPEQQRLHTVITPHMGEAARLLSCTAQELAADSVGAAKKLAAQFGCVAVLKGHPTITATPTGQVYVNTTGNPGMASGGMGDVQKSQQGIRGKTA